MDEKYEHIDTNNEKVLRIVNASFEVFAKNELEKASTNVIVKKAEVSRGLLYHYFENKEDLFEFLICFSTKFMVDDIGNKLDWEEKDFFNRMRQAAIIKCELMNVYPYMIEFLEKYKHRITRDKLKKYTEEVSPGIMEKAYTYNLDFSGVKEDVDIEKMKKIIIATLAEIIREHWELRKNTGKEMDRSKIEKECDSYVSFFRKHFYK
ncbi:TetR/AcrR family transcriptional regulator [Oceanirhabdus seepicola]|uniref:TetR/AcrR family transcriptional regulator n=1 Tax=Oceanirhabdus seepicola TaxID=2828781 RepID=A0A9J6NYB3_9CLOT|nr:TetR/AcrR family transcriptional regulator [Oceanirhabdus seepicola]MCM1988881.1 TetR/AcrR family transcriptional regulator [Oceanirhabdus seepicola]